MNRRELIILFGGAALLDAPIGRAQEPGRVYRVGVMHRGPREGVDFACTAAIVALVPATPMTLTGR